MEYKFATAGDRAPHSARPKMRDVSSAYAKALDHWQRLSAELARLEGLDPKNVDIFASEFGAGDIGMLEGLRQGRIRELRGTPHAEGRDGLVKRAHIEAERLRDETSALVRRRVQPEFNARLEAVVAGAREMLEAVAEHDALIAALEADRVLVSPLLSNSPPNPLVRELRDWLKRYDNKRGRP